MEERKSKKGTGYFNELALRFNQEQIECATPENDRLPLLLNGQEIGVATPDGGMRICKEYIDEQDASDLYYRAGEIAAEVREYMNLMESAPPLKASGLDMPYRQLSGLEVTLANAMSRETVLRTYLSDLHRNYDYILIDCSPSLGMLTLNALTAADRIIIPVQAHALSRVGLSCSSARNEITPPRPWMTA